MSERTWEIQDPKGDAALVDPGPTFDRTNEEYKAKARKALDFDPGPMRRDKQ